LTKIIARFTEFIVEESLDETTDMNSLCPFDKFLLSFGDKKKGGEFSFFEKKHQKISKITKKLFGILMIILIEFCDHSMAEKDQQVKKFTPKSDPRRMGWFRFRLRKLLNFDAVFRRARTSVQNFTF